MTNSRASSKMLLLDHHVATGTEATYTYTPTNALDMKLRYRQIKIIITGKATAAFQLQLVVNTSTDYDLAYLLLDTTTVSGALLATNAVHATLNNSHIDGAVHFYAELKITFNDAGDFLMISSTASAPHEGLQFVDSQVMDTATTVTSIETKTSTSTWIAGTEITTYGILR